MDDEGVASTVGGIASLRLRKKAKLSAILTDGAELPLPAVRVRDLSVLARRCQRRPAA